MSNILGKNVCTDFATKRCLMMIKLPYSKQCFSNASVFLLRTNQSINLVSTWHTIIFLHHYCKRPALCMDGCQPNLYPLLINKSILPHRKYLVSSLLGTSHMESIKNNKEALKKVEGMYARAPLVAWKEAIEVASTSTQGSSDSNRLSLARSLDKPTTASPIFSTDKNTCEGLITEYNNSLKFTGKALEESQFVLLATNNISCCHSNKIPCQTVFQLGEGVFFNTCLSFPHPPNCLHFKLLTNYCVMRHFCDNCKSANKNSQRCAERKEEDVGNRGAISS